MKKQYYTFIWAVAAFVLLLLGILDDGMRSVWMKGVLICWECIGLG